MKSRCLIIFAAVAVLTLGWAGVASSGSHKWRFNELFSNADGTIQFIEMKECCGAAGEFGLSGKWVLVVGANNQFDFDRNLTGDTSFKHLLLATQAFVDLPGAPTPDFIIPDNFLPLGGDTLEYWSYGDATMTFGALPTDGINSLTTRGGTETNSPTNYAGQTGSIDATPVEPITWGQLKIKMGLNLSLW